MPRRIYKYLLQLNDTVAIALPYGAKVLDIQEQQGSPVLWALVEPDALTEQRTFCVAGTGHAIDEHIEAEQYISTFQMHGGDLVWHVFETTPEPF